MTLSQLADKITQHFSKNIPFVVYAQPDTSEVSGSFQTDDATYLGETMDRSGFLFAPFSEGETLLIPSDKSEHVEFKISEEIPTHQLVDLPEYDNAERAAYENMVAKAVTMINDHGLSKIVTSRSKEVALEAFNFETLLVRLFQMYLSAFRYIWFHPKTGVWFGATPEVLLQSNEQHFATMALAGTKSYTPKNEPIWTAKERLEQQWVADAISNRLSQSVAVLKVGKIRNQRAGSVVHLCTDFTGTLNKGQHVDSIAKLLHPTPAVCGTPQEEALQFILTNELHKRRYYTGYLGPIDVEKKETHFFVNLRCASYQNGYAQLYVGGGITFASDPSEEWEETQKKSQTMLQVLAPMLQNRV